MTVKTLRAKNKKTKPYISNHPYTMTEDKIKLIIQSMVELRDELKEVKKEKKEKEKEVPEDIAELAMQKRDIGHQHKDRHDEFIKELREDKDYKQITKDIVLTEEKIAQKKQDLFKEIATLKRNIPLNMDIQVGDRLIKLQTEPTVKVYLNGKEEK